MPSGNIKMKKTTKTNWEMLASEDDDKIDYSDIEETNEEFWKDAELVHPQKKVEIKIKVDEDLANWLINSGDNSIQAFNNILRGDV